MRTSLASLTAVLVAVAVACAGGSPAGGTSDVVVQIPFAGGERLMYVIEDDFGETIGRGTLWTQVLDGGRWRLEQLYKGTAVAGVQPLDTSVAIVDALLVPEQSARHIQRGDDSERYEIEYRPAEERFVSLVASAGEEDEREFRLREHAYDNESSLWLWRTLDLAEGYEARYVSINALERSQQTVILRVIDRRMVEVPAGEFDVWRLQIRNGRATRVVWIEVASPHRVVQWDNGVALMRLEAIESVVEP